MSNNKEALEALDYIEDATGANIDKQIETIRKALSEPYDKHIQRVYNKGFREGQAKDPQPLVDALEDLLGEYTEYKNGVMSDVRGMDSVPSVKQIAAKTALEAWGK